MSLIKKILDGEFLCVDTKDETLRLGCCDCGLTHDFIIKIRGTKVFIRILKNRRCTSAKRRFSRWKGERTNDP